MDLLDNTLKLRDLIMLCGGQITGRKKLQKIVFIIQEYFRPFEPPLKYRWNYYGVYSADLSNELGIGQFFSIFQEIPVLDHGYQSYAIEVIDKTDTTELLENQKLKELAGFLNAQEPRLLEVISSIIFFRNQGCSKKEVASRLKATKGHLIEFFAGADEALTKIADMLD